MNPEQFLADFGNLVKDQIQTFPLRRGDSSINSDEDGTVAWSSNQKEGRDLAKYLRVDRKSGVLIVEGCLNQLDFVLKLGGSEEGLYLGGKNSFKRAPTNKETVIKVLEEFL